MVCKKTKIIPVPPRSRTKPSASSFLIQDWTTLDGESVFFNERNNVFSVVVETKWRSPGGDKLPSRLEDAKRKGVNDLLISFGKVSSTENFNKLFPIATTEYFIPSRPNPKCETENTEHTISSFGMKVLVSVSAPEFDKIPFEEVKDNPNAKLPLAKKEITLETNGLKAKISSVIKKIKEQDRQNISTSFNFDKETQKLNLFLSAIQNLFITNGVVYDESKQELIIIGLDGNYNILYVLVDTGETLLNLSHGFKIFSQNKAVKDRNTIGFISKLGEIENAGTLSPELTAFDFFTDFVLDAPDINISFDTKKLTTPFSKKVQNKMDAKSAKSEEDVEQEDQVLGSASLKSSMDKENKDHVDFVGDAVLSFPTLESILDKVESLEDVYDEVLAKVGIENIIATAIRCLPIPSPCELAKIILFNLGCDEFLNIFTSQLGVRLLDIPEFDVVIREELRACIKKMNTNEKNATLSRIQFAANRPVNSLKDLDGISLGTIFQGLGVQGDRLLKAFCDDSSFKRKLVDSIPDDICEKFNLDLIKIPKFRIPTINLPDDLPTIDIMGEITARIEAAITDALVVALVEVVKGIIKGIIENCGDLSDVNFGALDINTILADSLNLDVDTDAFLNLKGSFIEGLNIDVGNKQLLSINFEELLDDISSILSPSEIASLLNGSPTGDTNKLISCLVETKYSGLSGVLGNVSQVEKTFASLGKLTNKQILINQVSRRDVLGTPEAFCEPENDNVRKALLKQRGLTPEEIDNQLALLNKKKLDRLQDLLGLLKNNDFLKDAVPPVFCSATKKNSLIPRDHASFDFMLDRTIDTIYDGTYISFNQEIASFPTLLKDTSITQTPKEIPRRTNYVSPDGTEIEIPNPEFRRLIAQGVPIENPDDDGEPVLTYEDTTFASGFVAKGLKDNLEGIETNPKLFDFSQESGTIRLIIPNNMDSAQITNILSQSGVSQEEIDRIQNTEDITSIFIDYILPLPDTTQSKDRYFIRISTKKQNSQTEEVVFSSLRSTEIKQEVLDFIAENNLEAINNSSLPQSYFASFIGKIFRQGTNIYQNGVALDKPAYAQGISTANNSNTIATTLKEEMRTNTFRNIFIDVFANFSRTTAKSPLFSANTLSLINFTPEKNPKCDGHLLNIQKIKDSMKQANTDSECVSPDFATKDGLGKEEMSALETAGIDGAVITFVRLYVVESLLRTIFSLTQFKIDKLEEIDDVVINFISKNILKDIQSLGASLRDPLFQKQFEDNIVRMYNALPENISSQTEDAETAINFFVKQEIRDVFSRMNKLLGVQGDIDENSLFTKEWLPIFDAPTTEQVPRFAEVNAATIKNIVSSNNFSNTPQKTTFNIGNGNLILEKYIRVEDASQERFNIAQSIGEPGAFLFGVVNVREWNGFVRNYIKYRKDNTNGQYKIADNFVSWRYGLRLSYVPPVSDFVEEQGQSTIFPASVISNIMNNAGNKKIKAQVFDKAFEVKEITSITQQNGQQEIKTRNINTIPLVCVEQEINLNELDNTPIDTINIEQNWINVSQNLLAQLQETKEYKFLFSYCFPLSRMGGLVMLYSINYLSQIKKLKTMFAGTKTNLKSVFQALLGSGNYQYEDQFVKNSGGNAGLITTQTNNLTNEPEIDGTSVEAIAARTPLLIFKGICELTDTLIGRAKKIVDKAKDAGKEINFNEAVFGQLPMNIIPPPPLGPGIGPPLTTFGALYLALDLEKVMDDAKGKDVRRQSASLETGLNLNVPEVCEDEN